MLKERLAHPDCNAGVVFDNIESRLYKTAINALELIMRATPTQKLQVVALVELIDDDKLPQSSIIHPGRYQEPILGKEELKPI